MADSTQYGNTWYRVRGTPDPARTTGLERRRRIRPASRTNPPTHQPTNPPTHQPTNALPLQLLHRSRPVVAQESGQRPIRQQPPVGLASRTVVGLVVPVANPLHRRAAVGARLPVAAVHRHPIVEGGHLLREALARLAAQPARPLDERGARRVVQPSRLVVAQSAGELEW